MHDPKRQHERLLLAEHDEAAHELTQLVENDGAWDVNDPD